MQIIQWTKIYENYTNCKKTVNRNLTMEFSTLLTFNVQQDTTLNFNLVLVLDL